MILNVDQQDYHVVELKLRSRLMQSILQTARAHGKRPGLKDLAIESIELAESWCEKHCKSGYLIDPFLHLQILFVDPREAVMFKLANG